MSSSSSSSASSSSSTPHSFILFATVLSLTFLPPSLSQSSPSPSSAPPPPFGPANLTGILDKNGQYTFFIRLLNTTQVATQIENQLNTSTEGLTVFAPTDNAFNTLPSGTINNLNPEQQVQLVLFHVLPKYYSLQSLLTVSNPVRTQANYGLNFTGQGNQVNVSSGMVQTQINNALYQQSPLAVYEVDKVLLPPELFLAPAPTSSAPPPSKSSGSNSTTEAPSKSADNSGAVSLSGIRISTAWLGLVVGALGVVFMGGFA